MTPTEEIEAVTDLRSPTISTPRGTDGSRAGYQGKDPGATYARDYAVCECGHKNLSHGYGDQLPASQRSRIGLGPCGIDLALGHVYLRPAELCPCEAFTLPGANG